MAATTELTAIENESPLRRDPENEARDYILDPDSESIWIKIGPLSVQVVPGSEGVQVNIVPNSDAFGETLDSASATYAEANALADASDEHSENSFSG